MQDTKQNVVELSQYGRPHVSSSAHPGRTLENCGETLAMQLGQAMAKTLKLSGEDLLELIDRITGYEMRRLYGEAREFTRDKSDAMQAAVKKHGYLHFKRECRRDKTRNGQDSGLDMSQLSLVEPDDLEESLAASNIAHAIGNICGEELFGLSKRMGALLDDPELQFGDNPVGPEVIGAAVMDALREHLEGVKQRLALVPLICKYLPQQVREIYQNINRDLIGQGVLPTIRVGLRRAHPTGMPGMGGSAQAMCDEAISGGQDLLAALQQLLARGGGPAVAAPGLNLPAGGLGTPDTPLSGVAGGNLVLQPVTANFLQGLTRLQRGQADVFANLSLAAEQVADGQINVLRELRGQASSQGMAQMDVMTLDIVAMVFDYVLGDKRIPDAMKALIGRLQIPVLKVALLDRGFFAQKHHVVRRLLDSLADAAVGWDEAEGHRSSLYRKVDEVVSRIINQFEDQVDIFETCLGEFEQYLAEENQRMAEAASRSALLIRQTEMQEQAHSQARDTVRGHLFDKTVPALIRDFLTQRWTEVLASIDSRHGMDSERWNEAVATMRDLLWSVEPKHIQGDRKRLVELLPKLLKRLDQGLRDIGLDGPQRDEFFTGLVKCHAEAVRASMQATPATASEPVPETAVADEPAPTGPSDFEAVPAADMRLMPSPDLLREIAGTRTDANGPGEVEEITISDVHWLAGGDYKGRDEYQERVHSLRRGAWIEYRQEDGQMARAKLAWVSPLKGVYLFTNRLGQRAMSINAEGLAAKFREGSVQMIDNVPLMDRAVNNLLERLQQPSAVGSQ